MKQPLPVLYKRTKKGQIQQWQIVIEDNSFYTIEGIMGGAQTQSKPTFCYGKNIGKSNESEPDEQAYIEAIAKHDKKLKSKYYLNIKDIDDDSFFEPALCEKYVEFFEKIDFKKGVALELKLNGSRCVITSSGAFSRKGEEYFCLDHIKNVLKPIFDLYPDAVIDGELFNPALKNRLNVITKLVSVNRKAKDVTPQNIIDSEKYVQFHIYDGLNFNGIDETTPFIKRKEALKELIEGLNYCYYHPYEIVFSDEDVRAALKKTKDNGDEGIVIKILDAPYKNGRSKNFLKLKNWIDEEFEILGFMEGEGNWAGCVKMVVCKLNQTATNGKTTFESNIRGTMEELTELWNNRHQHVGKKATVDFQEYSEYNIPLIPYTQLPFRDYE